MVYFKQGQSWSSIDWGVFLFFSNRQTRPPRIPQENVPPQIFDGSKKWPRWDSTMKWVWKVLATNCEKLSSRELVACRFVFFHWDNASSKVLFRSLQRDDVCSHELSSKWLWKCCFAKCGCVWTWGLSRKDWYNQQISDNFPFRWNAAATCCRCRGHTAAGHGLPGELDFKTKDTKGPGRRGKSFIKWWLNQENRSLWIYLDMENPWEPEKCGDPFGPWSTFMLGGPYRCDKIGG